eukprot:624160-Pelagomonas_calceolata.AAC.2
MKKTPPMLAKIDHKEGSKQQSRVQIKKWSARSMWQAALASEKDSQVKPQHQHKLFSWKPPRHFIQYSTTPEHLHMHAHTHIYTPSQVPVHLTCSPACAALPPPPPPPPTDCVHCYHPPALLPLYPPQQSPHPLHLSPASSCHVTLPSCLLELQGCCLPAAKKDLTPCWRALLRHERRAPGQREDNFTL